MPFVLINFVQIEYEKLGEDREIQIISAQKADEAVKPKDFDAQMSDLEEKVKQDLAMQRLLETQKANTNLIRQTNQERNQKKPTPKAQEAKQSQVLIEFDWCLSISERPTQFEINLNSKMTTNTSQIQLQV